MVGTDCSAEASLSQGTIWIFRVLSIWLAEIKLKVKSGAHIGIETFRAVVLVISVACTAVSAAPDVSTNSDTIADLESGFFRSYGTNSDSRSDNLVPIEVRS